ncbi:hypothetical protein EDD37DRAFT_652259 [Exophiala viscosa]|uniref:uncharacterized protein n=1 Tax=Exophiala viscosa TaxID=2486360 RepID=UPI00219B96D3|nr:hypothetical protein EDD37DRAFT_652259 [Exophiala viscosa]
MSGPGPSKNTAQDSPQVRISSQGIRGKDAQRAGRNEEQLGQRSQMRMRRRPTNTMRDPILQSNTLSREIPFAHMRVHFEDFAKELRLHRHHEHRKRLLSRRHYHLQNAVALSSRLYRVGEWLHTGVVAISCQSDANGFARVHQHLQELSDSCISHWNHEINTFQETPATGSSVKASFLANLPISSQQDCIELIQTLRSNPRFLVERFRALSPAQISSLSTAPKYQKLSESVLTSLSQNRGRGSQKRRVKAYSKELEDYASSFERSNPLSFLIHNVYGSYGDIQSDESRLRLYTWSTICATLMSEFEQAFHAILTHVLRTFADMYEWQIKERLELFLMSFLQKGGFLLEMIDNPTLSLQHELAFLDPFSTQEARDFLETAVKELFEILGCDGGIPSAALALGRAIIGKLPTMELQSQFRGTFFFQWYLRDFLRHIIEFPEEEKLLHQFHVSDKARSHLLHKLWDRASAGAEDAFSPIASEQLDSGVRDCILSMINQLHPDTECSDPYQARNSRAGASIASLSICAADIAHILEALSPQFIHTSSPWDPFLSSSHSTFSMQYSGASSKFDKLRRRILDSVEPGQSSKSVHPCQENWALLSISDKGHLYAFTDDWSKDASWRSHSLRDLQIVEEAALRLVEGVSSVPEQDLPTGPGRLSTSKESSLCAMFAEQASIARIKTDSIMSMYWDDALTFLKRHYPLTVWTGDDTRILGPFIKRLKSDETEIVRDCLHLEKDVAQLEASYGLALSKLSQLSAWLDKLRTKLWYKLDVVDSKACEDARNISMALNNMAASRLRVFVPSQAGGTSPGSSRPGTAGTTASSRFEQSRVDTISMLKAPSEYGGPKKLSDAQIEITKRWLERNHLDNFCKGEERIHRFCMEIKVATRKLVGETLTDSPVLWSSELFSLEKSFYDIHAGTIFSTQPSTRPPSVWSEPLSSAWIPSRSRPGGSRASFHSQGSGRLGSDLASLISSPGRAATVTTLESGSSFWSPPQSNPRSVTSASSLSRPASTFEDMGSNRQPDHTEKKAAFLDRIQQDLTCLLLSDLASPVWSCGSETDAWMASTLQASNIVQRIGQRGVMARLLDDRDFGPSQTNQRAAAIRKHRSQSAAPGRKGALTSALTTGPDVLQEALNGASIELRSTTFSYKYAFEDVIWRISEHVDPSQKLKAIQDFMTLSQALRRDLKALADKDSDLKQPEQSDPTTPRRRSLDPNALTSSGRRKHRTMTSPEIAEKEDNTESETVDFLKRILVVLRPKTIFRDLQYVAAFVSSDTLDDTDLGRAFLQVGLASLAWKDEVCRAMVDVADRIVARDSIKRPVRHGERSEPSVLRAADYWVIAAREGNAIAQRELASLYLTHPEVLPIVSLPLTLSSEIFKNDMMWEDASSSPPRNRQALCLAVHWMQQAAENGDELAQTKLKERRAARPGG